MNTQIAQQDGQNDLPANSQFQPVVIKIIAGLLLLNVLTLLAFAGGWSDDFSQEVLGPEWRGDMDYFSIVNGALKGISASPLAPVPLRWVEGGTEWSDCVVRCWINVVTPNLLVCTKGALILRHSGNEGYVFALHVATQTVEVFRLSDQAMLLSKAEPLELQKWYRVRAELQGDNMSFFLDDKLIGRITDQRSGSGTIGLGVQDALEVLFDDLTVTDLRGQDNALTISRAGGKITLAWPISASGLVIQTTDDLSPSAKWTTLTDSPVQSGYQNILVLDIGPGRRFYRFSQ
jgi:hypothetical protein